MSCWFCLWLVFRIVILYWFLTLETIQEVQSSNCPHITLPNPQLYIIVNGKLTKSKVAWRSSIDVNHVKAAIKTLKSCNWHYKMYTKSP